MHELYVCVHVYECREGMCRVGRKQSPIFVRQAAARPSSGLMVAGDTKMVLHYRKVHPKRHLRITVGAGRDAIFKCEMLRGRESPVVSMVTLRSCFYVYIFAWMYGCNISAYACIYVCACACVRVGIR